MEICPHSSGGATPITPKKGESGSVIPGPTGTVQVITGTHAHLLATNADLFARRGAMHKRPS